MPRLHCPLPLTQGAALELPAGAARHVQVLRLQPGEQVTLFNGEGGEYEAEILEMGRQHVAVRVGAHHAVDREATLAVHLALAVPAGERMDWLVEKATELGAASIQPLLAERSVLRLAGERAERKQQHWQAVAVAACEQCGRNRVPAVHAMRPLREWLAAQAVAGLVLSLQQGSEALAAAVARAPLSPALSPEGRGGVTLLSGPEGGLAPAEEQAALAAGWRPVHLGPRILRAETAPLAALAVLTLGAP